MNLFTHWACKYTRYDVCCVYGVRCSIVRLAQSHYQHALRSPVLSRNYGLFQGQNYREGTKADKEWKDIGCSGPIPLQDRFRPGHWNEACMKDELMTPVRTGERALSRITIGALEDLGYGVDYDPADEFTIDDLGTCRDANCPEADNTSNSLIPVYEPTEAEVTGILNDVKDDLLYFHEQLKTRSDCVEGGDGIVECDGYAALEEVDVLYVGEDGERHSYVVTYDDVKDL